MNDEDRAKIVADVIRAVEEVHAPNPEDVALLREVCLQIRESIAKQQTEKPVKLNRPFDQAAPVVPRVIEIPRTEWSLGPAAHRGPYSRELYWLNEVDEWVKVGMINNRDAAEAIMAKLE